jgi:hypothetical protein
MDNSNQRLNDVFFYGLYMDEEILKTKNVVPRNKRIAVAYGYSLRIGKMATLLRKEDAKTYGLVYSLTHDEIDILYKKAGLIEYVTEALIVKLEDGSSIATLCCNLLNPPVDNEHNDKYHQKLITCMENYKLPIPKKV